MNYWKMLGTLAKIYNETVNLTVFIVHIKKSKLKSFRNGGVVKTGRTCMSFHLVTHSHILIGNGLCQ